MDLLLGALGMLACLAVMMVLMPLAMRVVRRLRPGSTTHAPDPKPPDSRDASNRP